MFEINSDYSISLTRGDTATLELTFTGDAPEEDDTVIAALKISANRKDAIWEKEIARQEDGTYLLTIDSADTVNLPFGRYFWDLRIIYSDGQITTPFLPKLFRVLEVVTDLPEEGDG